MSELYRLTESPRPEYSVTRALVVVELVDTELLESRRVVLLVRRR